MKNLFITLACMWLTFCLLLIPLIIGYYETTAHGIKINTENGSYYFGAIK